MNWIAIGCFWLVIGGVLGIGVLATWWFDWVTRDTGWLFDGKRTVISVLVGLAALSVLVGVLS